MVNLSKEIFNKIEIVKHSRQKHQNVSNKAKKRISRRRSQENNARRIFRTTNIFYLLVRTRALFSCYFHFEIRLFALLPVKNRHS